MKSLIYIFFFLNLFLFTKLNAQSQCIDTLPVNTVVIISDTIISNATGINTYLICPGVEVNYTGSQSTLNTYYLESSASLEISTYHYPKLYLKSSAEVIANHSNNNIATISTLHWTKAENGAIFTDTLNSWVEPITWCSNLIFDYSNLPGGIGCPTNTAIEHTATTNFVTIYPNPASDVVTIDNVSYAKTKEYSIKIFNALAQEVYNRNINMPQLQIPVSTLGTVGTYYIHILDGTNNPVEIKQLILN